MTKCPVCGSPIDKKKEYCEIHERAYNNLKQTFARWQKAHGSSLSFDDYSQRVSSLDEAGGAVKEVVGYLAKRGEAKS